MGVAALQNIWVFVVRAIVVVLALLSYVAYLSNVLSPLDFKYITVLNILLPIFIIINFIFFLIYLRQNIYIAVLTFFAVAIHYAFIGQTFQLGSERTLVSPKPVNSFRVLTYNTRHLNYRGSEIYTIQQLAILFKEKDIDFLNLQEFPNTKHFDSNKIMRELPNYPYCILPCRGKCFGDAAFFSKYPILDHGFFHIENKFSQGLWADVDFKGKRIRFICVHMCTTSVSGITYDIYKGKYKDTELSQVQKSKMVFSGLMGRSLVRSRESDQVAAFIKSSPYPVIISGDFNDPPASYTYRTLRADLKDGFLEVGHGFAGSFMKTFGLLRIDFTFHSSSLECTYYNTLKWGWSDHYPVLSEYNFILK